MKLRQIVEASISGGYRNGLLGWAVGLERRCVCVCVCGGGGGGG